MSLLRAEKITRRLEGEVPVTLVADADVSIERGEFVVSAKGVEGGAMPQDRLHVGAEAAVRVVQNETRQQAQRRAASA